MIRNSGVLVAVLVAGMAIAPHGAHADDAVHIADDWPLRLVDRPLIMGPSMFEVGGNTLVVELSKDRVGDPIGLAPHIYYGVNRKFTLGVTHRNGICISGDGCGSTYNDITIDTLFSLLYGGMFQLATHSSVQFDPFSPFTGGINVGLAMRLRLGDVGVVFDPRLYVGVFNRDNRKETLDLPLQLAYQLNDQGALLLSTGLIGPLEGFGDAFRVPIGLGVLFAISHRFDTGFEMSFADLGNGDFDKRQLIVRIALRL